MSDPGASDSRREVGIIRAEMTDQPIDVRVLAAEVRHSSAGAVVTFEGVVRDHDGGGRSVRELEYTSHPTADGVIAGIAEEVAAHAPGIRALAIVHRIGPLVVGDTAIACAVAADHRKEAFAACSDLIEEVKKRLPVWKRQVFTDGTEEWVNCP